MACDKDQAVDLFFKRIDEAEVIIFLCKSEHANSWSSSGRGSNHKVISELRNDIFFKLISFFLFLSVRDTT